MATKDPTTEVLEAKLQEADAEISRLQALLKQQKATGEIREKLNLRMQEIRERRDEVKQGIDSIKQKAKASYDDLEKGVHNAWQSLSDAITRASKEFK